MKIRTKYFATAALFNKVQWLPLLSLRLVLAYGFYGPAKMKLASIADIASWFEEIGIPLPHVNAYLATGTEVLGVVLLALGLGTRLIAIPLIVTMLVAIATVHWANGFEAGNNGFEIPLYYIAMLLVLLFFGAGKLSIDELLTRQYKQAK